MAKLPKNSQRGAGYSLTLSSTPGTALSPNDATTYYWGRFPQLVPGTTPNTVPVYIPDSGFLNTLQLTMRSSVTTVTNEPSSVWLRVNNTTDYLIADNIEFSGGGVQIRNVIKRDLNIAVSIGDFLEMKWTTPTWATNPTAVSMVVDVIIRR